MEILKRYDTIFKLILLFILMTISAIGIKLYFKPFWALIIMFILSSPLYNLFIKMHLNNKISAILSIIIINTLFFVLITILSKSLYEWLIRISIKLNDIFKNELFEYKYVIDCIKKIRFLDALNFVDKGTIVLKIRNTGSQFIGYIIGNIVCYFILAEKKIINDVLIKILSEDILKRIKVQKDNIVRMLLIEFKLIIISTFQIILGFRILNIKNSVLLGIICGILDLLPFIGTILVFLPLLIYNIMLKKYFIALGLIFLYILVEIIRQILEAKLLGNKLNIHPIIIFLSIYIGIEIFGIIGVIFGPLYCIIAKDFILELN